MMNSKDQSLSQTPNINHSEEFNLEACRICLATDVKMYSLQNTILGRCMDSLAGYDGTNQTLPKYVCYECAHCLIKCSKLLEKSRKTEITLSDIFAKNGQITKSLIMERNRSQLNLQSPLNSYIFTNYLHRKNYDVNQISDFIETQLPALPNLKEININLENVIQKKLSGEENSIDKTNTDHMEIESNFAKLSSEEDPKSKTKVDNIEMEFDKLCNDKDPIDQTNTDLMKVNFDELSDKEEPKDKTKADHKEIDFNKLPDEEDPIGQTTVDHIEMESDKLSSDKDPIDQTNTDLMKINFEKLSGQEERKDKTKAHHKEIDFDKLTGEVDVVDKTNTNHVEIEFDKLSDKEDPKDNTKADQIEIEFNKWCGQEDPRDKPNTDPIDMELDDLSGEEDPIDKTKADHIEMEFNKWCSEQDLKDKANTDHIKINTVHKEMELDTLPPEEELIEIKFNKNKTATEKSNVNVDTLLNKTAVAEENSEDDDVIEIKVDIPLIVISDDEMSNDKTLDTRPKVPQKTCKPVHRYPKCEQPKKHMIINNKIQKKKTYNYSHWNLTPEEVQMKQYFDIIKTLGHPNATYTCKSCSKICTNMPDVRYHKNIGCSGPDNRIHPRPKTARNHTTYNNAQRCNWNNGYDNQPSFWNYWNGNQSRNWNADNYWNDNQFRNWNGDNNLPTLWDNWHGNNEALWKNPRHPKNFKHY